MLGLFDVPSILRVEAVDDGLNAGQVGGIETSSPNPSPLPSHDRLWRECQIGAAFFVGIMAV